MSICESFFFLNFLLFDIDWEEANESWLHVESCESSGERKDMSAGDRKDISSGETKDVFSSEKDESWNTLEYVSSSKTMLYKRTK